MFICSYIMTHFLINVYFIFNFGVQKFLFIQQKHSSSPDIYIPFIHVAIDILTKMTIDGLDV
jgi:hypothetical protein